MLDIINIGVNSHYLVFFPAAARGRLEGNHNETSSLLSGPLAPDSMLHPGCLSARAPQAYVPRIGPNATHILERGRRGVVGELLKLDGVSVTPIPKPSKCDTWQYQRSFMLVFFPLLYCY